MRKPNFSKLSTEVLEKYLKDIESQLAKRAEADQKRVKALTKLQAVAKAEGIELSELASAMAKPGRRKKVAAKKTSATRSKVAPKYRNPKNTSETWTGRGRKPKWIEAHLNAGGKLEKILIKK